MPARIRQILFVVLTLTCLASAAFAQEKTIFLRNETIKTQPVRKNPQGQTVLPAQSVSGLWVIQFEEHFQPAWTETLRALRVDLLRPVPQDAFVAIFADANLTEVRNLGFVRHVMPYKPEHKIHAPLRGLEGGQMARVSVLLSPKADPREVFLTRRLLRNSQFSSNSRFGSVLRGEVSGAGLNRLSSFSSVLWVEGAPRPHLFDEISTKIVGGDNLLDHPSHTQNLGFDGKGVTISVADSGLNSGDAQTMHPDLAGRVDDFFFYGNLTDAADEHSHGTHVTGIIAGNGAVGETDELGYLYGLGVAPKAHIVAQRIFDGIGGYEAPPSSEVLTHDAVRAGAIIGSNSWGDDTQGRYDVSAMEFDALVRDADKDTPGDQPYILEFSAGNAGPGERTIGSPAVAKNVIATGASQNDRVGFFIYEEGQDAMADFSSRGPCEDGRIKPDVVAPGTWIASLQSFSASDENAWGGISEYYQYQGGTSQAGPHVSGAAAVFVQYYRETHQGNTPSPALVKAALINSAVDMENSDVNEDTPTPNQDEGWGRVDLAEIIGSDRKFIWVDQTTPVATGQTFEQRFVLADPSVPLKITMAYTDVPGAPFAAVALVNDLDLEVISPRGIIYKGNQFLEGESVPNAAGADHINNVEGVHLFTPEVGEYIVRIRGVNVVEDARRETVGVDQDFALVVSAALPLPGQGVIALDRQAYSAPGEMKIKLIDFDLAGQPSADVFVSSTNEPIEFKVTLQAFGDAGVFMGSVPIESGAPKEDNRLQVRHGDLIQVAYRDASPSSLVLQRARVDFVPPLITGITATNAFGREFIFWKTDELANSIVRYGTNDSLGLAVTNLVYDIDHEIGLPNLIPGRTYSFIVISADEAGNLSTNDNGGRRYTFIAQQPSAILLVDAYTHGSFDESIPLPLTTYTDPLDQIGIKYDVWSLSARGSPKASDMDPFKIVIWRINNSFYEGASLSVPQQNAIQQYVTNGGAFFIAGMELLSRMGDVPFRTNVLHVAEFTSNPLGDCPTCDEDHGVPLAEGIDSDPITRGMEIVLDYSDMPYLDDDTFGITIGPDVSDTFMPATNAAAIFLESESRRAAGVRFPRTGEDSKGRVVFLSFPFEGVPMTGDSPNTRVDLLRNIIGFLAPGLQGLGAIALDRAAYTVPSVVTVELSDSDLAGQRQASIQVFTTSATNGVPLTVLETGRPGVFRGTITLTAKPVGPSQIRGRHGDFVWAEYNDASTGRQLRSLARIDTLAPVISNIEVDPSWEEATISWNTSEPANALVQFGESPFLSRTVYEIALEESHELRLIALQPDKLYYYQVVSRDEAGNTTVDDNSGNLYTFRTLKPLSPPFTDAFDQSSTNWTVFNGEEAEGGWELGPPTNPELREAHSPPNVWGSVLHGGAPGYVDSFLISPAVQLSGGNHATLKFWHQYDFTRESLLEIGSLLLFTNAQAQPLILAEYGDFTSGWEQEEFDLTPYLGRVIQIVWHYQLLDFEDMAGNRLGWMVDDVSISVTNLVKGVIEVTNNLAQASFAVEGPTPANGEGSSLVLSNATAGTYIVRFGDIPYYRTPAPQTNILVNTGQKLIFVGNYTFPDVNGNGISDEWEQRFFGEVGAARTRSTDTDLDGAADYAEFIAGTDPTRADSVFQALTPEAIGNNRLKLWWPSVPGRYYRVLGSTDALTWTPFSGWLRALSSQTGYALPSLAGSKALLFKVEVSP